MKAKSGCGIIDLTKDADGNDYWPKWLVGGVVPIVKEEVKAQRPKRVHKRKKGKIVIDLVESENEGLGRRLFRGERTPFLEIMETPKKAKREEEEEEMELPQPVSEVGSFPPATSPSSSDDPQEFLEHVNFCEEFDKHARRLREQYLAFCEAFDAHALYIKRRHLETLPPFDEASQRRKVKDGDVDYICTMIRDSFKEQYSEDPDEIDALGDAVLEDEYLFKIACNIGAHDDIYQPDELKSLVLARIYPYLEGKGLYGRVRFEMNIENGKFVCRAFRDVPAQRHDMNGVTRTPIVDDPNSSKK